MPIYEYGCDRCGHEFEAEQRITDAPLKTCPGCRSRRLRRLISRTSFVLKGGGWYSDLYSSPTAKPEAAASEAAEKPAERPSGEAGSEAKPAADAKPATPPAAPKKDRKGKPDRKKGPKAAA